MSKGVPCKFFAQGSCTKGVYCKFDHDRNYQADSKPICFYYQRGNCTYGSQCRNEHVNISHQPIYTPSSNSQAHLASSSSQIPHSLIGSINGEKATSIRPRYLTNKSSWIQNHDDYTHLEAMAEKPLCEIASTGNCPHGDKCPHIHGDLCSTCKKHCLHPYRLVERGEHTKMCQHNKQIEILKLSEDIECCVCLERVHSKATPDERKFGLLSECDHSFCISCIRNWRNNSPDSGMDVNTALRACPVCRKISYFVVPSSSWYSTKEEKEEIISSYKNRLKSIDCKHYDFGSGICPFRNKCFYRHTYKAGRGRRRAQSSRAQNRNSGLASNFVDELELMALAQSLRIDEHDFDLDTLTNIHHFDFDQDNEDDGSSFEMAGLIARLMMELSVDDDDDDEVDDDDDDEEDIDDETDESDGDDYE